MSRARALIDLRRWDDALGILGPLSASASGDAEPMCLIAYVLLRSSRPREALDAATQAVVREPTNEWAHRLRALSLLRLSREDEAADAADEAVRCAPSSSEAFVTVAEIAMRSGLLDKADRAVHTALELDPTNQSALNLRGGIALRRGRPAEAEEHYRTALRADPNDPSATHNLGVALEQQGQTRRAIQYYANASRLDPTNSLHRDTATRAATAMKAGGSTAASVLLFIALRVAYATLGLWAVVIGLVSLAATVGVLWLVVAARRGQFTRRSDPKASRRLVADLAGDGIPRGSFIAPEPIRRWVLGPLFLAIPVALAVIGVIVMVQGDLLLGGAAAIGFAALAVVLGRAIYRRR